jgi:hypothetical protein
MEWNPFDMVQLALRKDSSLSKTVEKMDVLHNHANVNGSQELSSRLAKIATA